MTRLLAAASVVVCMASPSAEAASDEAWAAFRADVEAKCLAASAAVLDDAQAVVDPFGSARFGLALLKGRPIGGTGTASVICVYDKVEKTAEIGGELPEPS
jgi:hypothetical protein